MAGTVVAGPGWAVNVGNGASAHCRIFESIKSVDPGTENAQPALCRSGSVQRVDGARHFQEEEVRRE